jgi:hypothetical protein
VAAAARERTLDCHTAERRVLDLERAIEDAWSERDGRDVHVPTSNAR